MVTMRIQEIQIKYKYQEERPLYKKFIDFFVMIHLTKSRIQK